jgi:predicted nuclease of predicted toxin-antitoxin system
MLSERGWNAIHWINVGQHDAPDTQIMQYAKEHDYTVFTDDLDFASTLWNTKQTKPSVIQIRGQDVRPEARIDQVELALSRTTKELELGALVTINPHNIRLRTLPFGTEQ